LFVNVQNALQDEGRYSNGRCEKITEAAHGPEISDSKGNCKMKNANENCKLARVNRFITPVCAFSVRGPSVPKRLAGLFCERLLKFQISKKIRNASAAAWPSNSNSFTVTEEHSGLHGGSNGRRVCTTYEPISEHLHGPDSVGDCMSSHARMLCPCPASRE
jgi:hypothetical protein